MISWTSRSLILAFQLAFQMTNESKSFVEHHHTWLLKLSIKQNTVAHQPTYGLWVFFFSQSWADASHIEAPQTKSSIARSLVQTTSFPLKFTRLCQEQLSILSRAFSTQMQTSGLLQSKFLIIHGFTEYLCRSYSFAKSSYLLCQSKRLNTVTEHSHRSQLARKQVWTLDRTILSLLTRLANSWKLLTESMLDISKERSRVA